MMETPTTEALERLGQVAAFFGLLMSISYAIHAFMMFLRTGRLHQDISELRRLWGEEDHKKRVQGLDSVCASLMHHMVHIRASLFCATVFLGGAGLMFLVSGAGRWSHIVAHLLCSGLSIWARDHHQSTHGDGWIAIDKMSLSTRAFFEQYQASRRSDWFVTLVYLLAAGVLVLQLTRPPSSRDLASFLIQIIFWMRWLKNFVNIDSFRGFAQDCAARMFRGGGDSS